MTLAARRFTLFGLIRAPVAVANSLMASSVAPHLAQ